MRKREERNNNIKEKKEQENNSVRKNEETRCRDTQEERKPKIMSQLYTQKRT